MAEPQYLHTETDHSYLFAWVGGLEQMADEVERIARDEGISFEQAVAHYSIGRVDYDVVRYDQ